MSVWIVEYPNGARAVYDEPCEGAVEYIQAVARTPLSARQELVLRAYGLGNQVLLPDSDDGEGPCLDTKTIQHRKQSTRIPLPRDR